MFKNLPGYVKAGRLFRLFGWIGLIATIISFVGSFVISLPPGDIPRSQRFLATLLPVIIIGLNSILNLWVGGSIKEHKGWARKTGIVLSILFLLAFPIGTIIGAYTLWCLVKGWDPKPGEPGAPAERATGGSGGIVA